MTKRRGLWWSTSLAIVAALAGGGGCGQRGDEMPTWEEFRAQATRERVVDGVVQRFYVVEWDHLMNEAELRAYYDDRVADARDAPDGLGTAAQPSTVNLNNGARDVWPNGQEHDLTYCVSNAFGATKARVVKEMAAASAAWEAAADVRFTYLADRDATCADTHPGALFSVQPWPNENAARAFFPSSPMIDRTVLIDYPGFDAGNPDTPNIETVGVLRHELGHILGLRHEHVRVTGGQCPESNWAAVTGYDRGSVMHYPFALCGGDTTSDYALTPLDAQGARKLYGPPAVVTDPRFVRADYDGDGRADIALTGHAGWTSVPVAFSRPGGTFAVTSEPIPAFSLWSSMAGAQLLHGDFNGDLRTDLALVGVDGWTGTPIATSAGDGTFNVTLIPTGASFGQWAQSDNARPLVGDFNGDGRSDLALVGAASWHTIPVALSGANGTWSVINVDVGAFGAWANTSNAKVVVGDYDGDGRTDIALVGGAGWSTIPVAFSNGDGSFRVENRPVSSFGTWAAVPGVIVVPGDFDGNGRTDLALVGGSGWTTIPIATSVGDGSFAVTNQTVASFPSWSRDPNVEILAGDYNGDLRTDLALVGVSGWTTVPTAFSTGAGAFNVTNTPVASFPSLATTGAVALAADFNGDGRSDLALTSARNWSKVPLALSVGNGQFGVFEPNVGEFGASAAMSGVMLR